jgi:hypothetical protein
VRGRGAPARDSRIGARLAEAAALVAEDYLRFLSSADWQDPEAAKVFAARQAAAKSALAHLELLQKLAGDPEEARESVARCRALLLEKAQEATRDDDGNEEG